MSLNRCLQLLAGLGFCCVLAACANVPSPAASQADQTAAVKPSGACQGPDGLVADGSVVAKCMLPAQGVTGCPQYYCQRCSNGHLSGEYSCGLR
jgi:hypothetical protein